MEKSNNIKVLKGSKDLHSRIPRGGITLLAQKYGVTSQYIISIVSGKVNNKPGIIEDAYKLVEFFEKQQEEMKSQI
jgi:predicted transcriptional regulator